MGILCRMTIVLFCLSMAACKPLIFSNNKSNSSPEVRLPFTSIWKTTSPGEVITLPLVEGYNYDIKVDWGNDSEISEIRFWNDPQVDHTYELPGEYTITISGLAEAWSFKNGGSKDNIIKVTELGDLGWRSFASAFHGCTKLVSVKGGNTSRVTDMSWMFSNASIISELDTSNWNTSNVTNMDGLFNNAYLVNPDVSKWNTSKVTSMASMFRGTTKAVPDTSKWDISQVINMESMFKYAGLANPDTSGWKTSNVLRMDGMFRHAPMANPDVSKWDVSKVENTAEMFLSAIVANPDTSQWNTASLKYMNHMFQNASKANPDMSSWSFSNGIDMRFMFSATSLSVDNYSEILKRISDTSTASSKLFHAPAVKYNASAISARNDLISRGWTITDGGLEN